MRSAVLPSIAILLGLGLIALSLVALEIAPAQAFWTDADQAQYQQASADLHAAAHGLPSQTDGVRLQSGRPGYDPVAAKARYAAAKSEWDRQAARLLAAQSRRHWLLWGLRLLGTGLAAVGIWGCLRGYQAR